MIDNKNNLKNLEKKLIQNLKKNPKDINSILSYGKLMGLNNDHSEAAKIFKKGIKSHPDNDTLNYNYAIALIATKKFYKGAIILRKMLSKYPTNNEILFSYSNALNQLKKYNLSLKYYYKLYSIDESNTDVLINIGIVFIALENYSKALSFLKLAFNARNNSSLITRNIGLCHKHLNNLDEAISYYSKSIELEKTYIGSYLALGSIFLDSNKNKLADDTFQKASNVAKKIIENYKINHIEETILNDIGVLFTILGNFSLAEKSLKILEERFGSNSSHKMLLSEILLSMGKFEEGWMYYESRFEYYLKEKQTDNYRNFPKPLWNPEMGNEKILIWAEQGLGDQILHGTTLNSFITKFKKAYLMVDPRLVKFFSEHLHQIKVIGFNENLNDELYDYHIPLGSIAQYTRKIISDFKTIGLKTYKNNNWKVVSMKRKIKCAISWKSINSFKSKYKSLNLKELHTVLKNPKIDFYNIQYTNETNEINELNKEYNISLKSPNGIDTYNDINGLMNFINGCDFVISVSNTSAHLSGILNKPTLLLLPKIYGTWWYWNNEYENKNIWYPSIKVFSQKKIGDWSSAIINLNKYIDENI